MPTFLVHTYHNYDGVLIDEYNNAEWFDIYYETYSGGLNNNLQRIEAINCVDYINGPYWADMTQDERDSALFELEYKEY